MGGSYYQQYYFDKEELDFAIESLNFFRKRKEILEEEINKENIKDEIQDGMKKLRRVEMSIKSLEYYYGFK